MRRYGDWIETYTGAKFYPLDPRPGDININDIAHALSNICRFTGHVSEFYSVAQHSVMVSNLVSSQYAKWGLMHDASEAYICDVARPLKLSEPMKPYRQIEKRIMMVVAEKFGLCPAEPSIVKEADNVAIRTEGRDFGFKVQEWGLLADIKPVREKIVPLLPVEAKELFLGCDNLAGF